MTKVLTEFELLRDYVYKFEERINRIEHNSNVMIGLREFYDQNKVDNEALSKVFNRFIELENSFNLIEPFVKYMMDYFNSEPKMKKEIEKYKKALAEKDKELAMIKETLRGALK